MCTQECRDETFSTSCHCSFSVWEHAEDGLNQESLQEAAAGMAHG